MKTWDEIEKTNEVAKAMRGMSMRANEVANGSRRIAWLYGPSGVGKSHTMRQALETLVAQGRTPMECNPANYKDMLEHFEATEGHHPIVFEEADVLWRSTRMLNILKIATDPIRQPWERHYQGIPLTAPIFVTTNVDLQDDRTWDKQLKIHGPALFRRSPPCGVTDDRDELFEFTVGLALYKRLIEMRTIEDGLNAFTYKVRSLNLRAEALDWFATNYENLTSVSPGTLQMIAETFDYYSNKAEREISLNGLLVTQKLRKPARRHGIDWRAAIMKADSVSKRAKPINMIRLANSSAQPKDTETAPVNEAKPKAVTKTKAVSVKSPEKARAELKIVSNAPTPPAGRTEQMKEPRQNPFATCSKLMESFLTNDAETSATLLDQARRCGWDGPTELAERALDGLARSGLAICHEEGGTASYCRA